ncbi:MAG: hypothetical protein WDO73_14270 [Ignavibacteriota bacterium]
MAALIVIDAGLTGGIDQDLGDHARGSLRGAQNLYERRHQRDQVISKDEEEDVPVAVQAGVEHDARLGRR